MKTFIIAEAGVNHNGRKDLAFQLVDAAVRAKADAIKFQTFSAESLVTKKTAKARYQQKNCGAGGSQFEMLKALELSHDMHLDLVAYCEQQGIMFLSTAFDRESLEFLVNDIGVSILKIPSGELTNGPFLLEHAKLGKPLILSTGMSNLEEISEALGVLAFGLMRSECQPSVAAFRAALNSDTGKQLLKENVTLLHCTTEYPAKYDGLNLLAMKIMTDTFGVAVGYSDHSEGIFVSSLAVAMGARVVEKHLTIDKTLPGPDHQASIGPDEFREMVLQIRLTEKVLGYSRKKAEPSERNNRAVVRRSLVALTTIQKGELFSESNVTTKRPASGMSPMKYWDLIGTQAGKDYAVDEVIFEAYE